MQLDFFASCVRSHGVLNFYFSGRNAHQTRAQR